MDSRARYVLDVVVHVLLLVGAGTGHQVVGLIVPHPHCTLKVGTRVRERHSVEEKNVSKVSSVYTYALWNGNSN